MPLLISGFFGDREYSDMKAFQRLLNDWIGDRPYEEVSPLLGAAFGTVHAWRHGTSLPPATRIPALAAALGVTEIELRRIIARDRARRSASRASHA